MGFVHCVLGWYGGREQAEIKMLSFSLGANWDGQDQARLHQRDSQRMSDVLEIKPARAD